MLLCWATDPKRRPRFADLVHSLGAIRGALAVTDDGKISLGYDSNTLMTSGGMVRGISIIRSHPKSSSNTGTRNTAGANAGAGASMARVPDDSEYSVFSDPVTQAPDDAASARNVTILHEASSDCTSFNDVGTLPMQGCKAEAGTRAGTKIANDGSGYEYVDHPPPGLGHEYVEPSEMVGQEVGGRYSGGGPAGDGGGMEMKAAQSESDLNGGNGYEYVDRSAIVLEAGNCAAEVVTNATLNQHRGSDETRL